MKAQIKRAFNWFISLDLLVLATLAVVLVGVWLFVVVANGVNAGNTQELDDRILRMLRDPVDPAKVWGPKWLEEVGRDLTALGGVAVLCLLTLAVLGYLLICRKYREFGLLLAATLGGLLLSTVLKNLFDRPRPSIVPHLSHVYTTSFPSGHSMNSAVVYLTLGSLLACFVMNRRLKIYFLGVAIFLSFLVGVSRVYMGVHYPTDVLAGWSVGASWGVLCGLMARWLIIRKRKKGHNLVTLSAVNE